MIKEKKISMKSIINMTYRRQPICRRCACLEKKLCKRFKKYFASKTGFRFRMFLPCLDPDPQNNADPDPGQKVKERNK